MRLLAAVLLSSLTTNVSQASVLTFDDGHRSITSNYQGFDWTNAFKRDVTLIWPISGLANGAVSGSGVLTNPFGEYALSMTKIGGVDFVFNGAYFIAAWRDDLTIRVAGLRDNELVGLRDIVVSMDAPLWYSFDWTVDAIYFKGSGGTLRDGSNDPIGFEFGIDNLTFNEAVATVPAPGSLALLSLGVIGLGLARHRYTFRPTSQKPLARRIVGTSDARGCSIYSPLTRSVPTERGCGAAHKL